MKTEDELLVKPGCLTRLEIVHERLHVSDPIMSGSRVLARKQNYLDLLHVFSRCDIGAQHEAVTAQLDQYYSVNTMTEFALKF